jgi:hypothetical protein
LRWIFGTARRCDQRTALKHPESEVAGSPSASLRPSLAQPAPVALQCIPDGTVRALDPASGAVPSPSWRTPARTGQGLQSTA